MDLCLESRTALIAGHDLPEGRACVAALRAEGMTILAADADPAGADVIVTVLPDSPPLDVLALDGAAQALRDGCDQLGAIVDRYARALGGMAERGFGRLIVVGSIAAKLLGEDAVVDRVTGLGLLGLQKTLSGEYGKTGVTANTVLVDRGITPREPVLAGVGAACAYLASRQAAYLTGVVMTVDAGRARSVF